MIRPPRFWSRADGAGHPAARILSPLSRLYAAADRNRRAKIVPFRADGPVICIGNATMGGVGKTPFAILVADTLRELGARPAFLTRGYGGSEKGPAAVSSEHDAPRVGDEALLLARHAPVIVARDREAGAVTAFASPDVDALVMDDGFQNPSLVKDLSFLLADALTGFGNGLIFPAGPLREPPEKARARAHALVVVCPTRDRAVPDDLREFAGELPVIRAWLEPVDPDPAEVIAFCGIGRPEKFYDTARAAGYRLAATRDFADHHKWTARDIAGLSALSEEMGLPLLTTEKDHVRLPETFRARVKTLPVRMAVDDPAVLRQLLSPIAGAAIDRTAG